MEQKENPELEVILEQNDDGGYTASVPSIPGCTSKGATIDEAVNNLKANIKAYIEKVMKEVVSNAKKEGI